MRLKTNYLKMVDIYRKQTVKSSYMGNETVFNHIGTVKADIQTAENSLNADIYGETVKDMKMLYLMKTDLKNSDRIRISDVDYEVISINEYITHMTAMVKKI